jgi:type II secretory pathway component PulC
MRLAFTLLLLAACGGAAPIAKAPPTKAAASTASELDAPPSSSLSRSQVSSAVHAGLGSFLQTVAIDEHPVFRDGKFHGFRIAGLAPQYARTGIVPGDVVTRVNGMPIERPEQAIEVFRSLEVASELHIDYERDGTPHELRLAIVDGQ